MVTYVANNEFRSRLRALEAAISAQSASQIRAATKSLTEVLPGMHNPKLMQRKEELMAQAMSVAV